MSSEFATALSDARTRGVDIRQLAKDVGIPPTTMQRIEDGERPVGWVARSLRRALGLHAEDQR